MPKIEENMKHACSVLRWTLFTMYFSQQARIHLISEYFKGVWCEANKAQQTSTLRHVDKRSLLKVMFKLLCFQFLFSQETESSGDSEDYRGMCSPVVMDQILTHQRTEGDDRQESLDQDAEPVGQSSVVAAVRIRLVDVGHVRDFKNTDVQEFFHLRDPAVTVQVHVGENNTPAGDKRSTSSGSL